MSSWWPLFGPDHPLHSKIAGCISSSCRALEGVAAEAPGTHGRISQSKPVSQFGPSLASGGAGIALTLSEAGERLGVRKNVVAQMVAKAVEEASDTDALGFFWGGVGVAWTLAKLRAMLGDALGGSDPTADFDRDLQECLAGEGLIGLDHDLCYGLSGIGTYLVERLDTEAGHQGLLSVLRQLEALADHNAQGLVWTSQASATEARRTGNVRANLSLGVAHGSGGVLGMLTSGYRAGCRDTMLLRLLEGGVERMLSDHKAASGQSTSISWCWGDLGISLVLLQAARTLEVPRWEKEALRIARACRRAAANSDLKDASLCHGFAGACHMFNRLYQATREPEFASTARSLAERVIAVRRPGAGIAGFEFLVDVGPRSTTMGPTPGILMGLAGVVLALAASIADVEPHWDQFMVMALPPLADA